jgi:hypothetical protein
MDLIYTIRNILVLFIYYFDMKETNAVFLFFQYLVGESFEDVKQQYGGGISNLKLELRDKYVQGSKKLGDLTNQITEPLKGENLKAAVKSKIKESKLKTSELYKKEKERAFEPLSQMKKSGFKFDEERARQFRSKNRTPFLEKIISFMSTLLFLITFPILPFFYIMKATINNFGTSLKGVLYSL